MQLIVDVDLDLWVKGLAQVQSRCPQCDTHTVCAAHEDATMDVIDVLVLDYRRRTWNRKRALYGVYGAAPNPGVAA